MDYFEVEGKTIDEALEKIQLSKDRGIDAPAFRAPGWLIDEAVYDACTQLNYTICDHKEHHVPYPNARIYTYNWYLGKHKRVRGVHGHMTPVMDNEIIKMLNDGRLTFKQDAQFKFPWEVSVTIPKGGDKCTS